MGDDTGDIIDISFDDAEESSSSADDVLDIELEPVAAPRAPVQAASTPPPSVAPRPPAPGAAPSDDSTDLPMTSSGVCPRCGYALRPMEDKCPRCARLGPAAPVQAPAPEFPAAGPVQEELPEAPRSRGCLVLSIIGGVLLLAALVGVPLAIYMQPAQRAKREYRQGLQAQLRAEFDLARQHYLKALDYDPTFGLAAFSMGTTYLGLTVQGLTQSMQEIMDRATRGQTWELDTADEWFHKTIEIGEQLPPGTRLMDQKIQTPNQLKAFARASLALTAFIRAAAAMNAEAFDDAMAWMQVVQQQAAQALLDDPNNPAAQQMLKSSQTMAPRAGGTDGAQ